jgi:transposase-like protein
MTCPSCGKPKAHRSHRSGLKDWALGFFHRQPFRCGACRFRFYVYRQGETSAKLRSSEERKILEIRRRYKWKKSRRQILAFTMVSLVLAAILYALMQQRIGGDS